ncbi:MAG TPA: LLM class F420-dependent oxidoreductase [Hyphomicrobiaceae bacterium]|nr:LLM class F420-dependent oxidoreductase [Hyphomicrobiaceae bacterium]
MKFGINTSARGTMSTRQAYMTIAQLAERVGFDFLSISDHVVVPRSIESEYPYSEGGKWDTAIPSGFCLEQLATICFLAGCTEKLQLLTSVMVVPHRPAVLTAKLLATADVLSNGRVLAGIGAGWLREEFEALQTAPYDQRGKVTDEYIESFKELWAKDAPSYQGEHVKFDKILFAPKPDNGASIPIWVGGESNPAMRRTAKLGDVWYPGSRNPKNRLDTPERLAGSIARLRKITETQGRDPDEVEVAFVLFTPVEWSPQAGHDTARRLMTGTAEQMAEDVQALADVGVKHFNLTFPSGSVAEMSDAIEKFSDRVMPLVKS